MIDRSNEIIKRLDRMANDRNLPLRTRNQIREAALHIKELHDGVKNIRELYLKLKGAEIN